MTRIPERYARQARFHGIGAEGQNELAMKRVLLVGLGALGAAVSDQLVRAGVSLILVDRDYVEMTNLQRQTLYAEQDALAETPKAIAAFERLKAINSDVDLNTHIADVSWDWLRPLPHVDMVLDATDNVDTRLLLNDFALERGIPFLFASCVGAYGMNYTVMPGQAPCLRCLMRHLPLAGQTCASAGVVAPIVQHVASRQAVETLKYLTGRHEKMERRLLIEDMWENQSQRLDVARLVDVSCKSCQQHEYPSLVPNRQQTALLCGRDVVQVRRPIEGLEPIANQLERADVSVKRTPFMLEWRWRNHRMLLFKDGRVLVHGVDDTHVAAAMVDECLGA
ncbi:ThiF family adenylyltransferase [Exiguobacterium aurantiacum]|uniref:Molybdopterin-synthase adenylyltransferase n=1 Tax=Exiguobacterium aurantiacum TaxID=33987 RepID=A0A377FYS4_9BACL|nr:ThiF family adenylyltransferase [Exiguobacterium aurantiacum]STO09463.1 Molybdopterin-synthase adenylyltransferase [Exiguobacterium aurantiacum]